MELFKELTAPQEARDQGAKIQHIFRWERDGWVMEYPDQGAEALCAKMAKSLYKRRGISLFAIAIEPRQAD